MTLKSKDRIYMIPEYSITGDILSYLKCGLQYRYQNKGELPPSKPVQLWFGQFIHGVMEESYLRWKRGTNTPLFPWDWNTYIRNIEITVFRRLLAGGLRPPRWVFCPYDAPNERSGSCPDLNHPHQLIASQRVLESINTWGPHLFPLISEAEVKLNGTRPMPNYDENISRSNYYGITGRIDVLASMNLRNQDQGNLILKYIRELDEGRQLLERIGGEDFEIIVDYKGETRPQVSPQTNDREWHYHQDQVLSYAWLREKQQDANKVKIGIIFYLNELVPSGEDIKKWKKSLQQHNRIYSDVEPINEVKASILNWKQEEDLPVLDREHKIRRSIRVLIIDRDRIGNSVARNDAVVNSIESSVRQEINGISIIQAWRQNPKYETCTICDFRTFCPSSADKDPPNISNSVM